MKSSEMRNQLATISRSLLNLHKLLLNFQKQNMESLSGKELSPHELLGMLMSHADFVWLRKLSTLIVRIDETVDDKKDLLESTSDELLSALRDLFIVEEKETEFKMRLNIALKKDNQLSLEVERFKKSIT
ncbi:MAG: hypothetical protein R3A80_13185 [Bdellovibrionota bacterium]